MVVTKQEIQAAINPTKLNLGIRNFKETKQGTIVVKCDTKEDLIKFKQEAGIKLKDKYTIQEPIKTLPKIKIPGYTRKAEDNTNLLEEKIRRQNRWINEADILKITYVREGQNGTGVIYAECSGSLYIRMMKQTKIYIDWERLPVYDNIAVSRCYQCQGFNHKSNRCAKHQICGNCAGNHPTKECNNRIKKCINCIEANKKYKLELGTQHTALDPDCPSLKYHKEQIRYKTDFN